MPPAWQEYVVTTTPPALSASVYIVHVVKTSIHNYFANTRRSCFEFRVYSYAYFIFWTLLRSRASEPCSLVIKVRALNAHAPTLTFPGARTRCSRPNIGTVFVCDKGPSIQRTGDFLVVLSRYPSHQYQYGCVIVLLLLAIHKDIRLIFISPL